MSSKLMPSSLQPLGILKFGWPSRPFGHSATVLGSGKAATEPMAAFVKPDSSGAPSSQDHPELKNIQEICELRVCRQASPPSHTCLEECTARGTPCLQRLQIDLKHDLSARAVTGLCQEPHLEREWVRLRVYESSGLWSPNLPHLLL